MSNGSKICFALDGPPEKSLDILPTLYAMPSGPTHRTFWDTRSAECWPMKSRVNFRKQMLPLVWS